MTAPLLSAVVVLIFANGFFVAAEFALVRTRRSRIDQRIAELERLKAGLTECIGCGCLSLERCQLANPADRAAGLGSGPRYWVADRPSG